MLFRNATEPENVLKRCHLTSFWPIFTAKIYFLKTYKNRFSYIIIRFSDFEINRLINRFLKTGYHPYFQGTSISVYQVVTGLRLKQIKLLKL